MGEACIHIAIICWTIAVCSAIVCVAVATHHIALLGAFIERDADLLRFVIDHYNYIDSPDYLLAITCVTTLIGLIANAFAILPIYMGIITAAICAVFWIGFLFAWVRGTKFWKNKHDENMKLILERKEALLKSEKHID